MYRHEAIPDRLPDFKCFRLYQVLIW